MQEEQPRRKPRVPLSPEELYYYKKIKQLNELKRVDDFKKTSFYKIVNTLNIILAAFLAYCVLSVLICSRWEQLQLASANCIYGQYNNEDANTSIVEIQLLSTTGELIPIKTSDLFEPPKPNAVFFVGKDFIFNKIIKVKFETDTRSFWHLYTYPIFGVCVFALLMGFFVYKVNKHLTINGLLTVFGLFMLASLYFVLT